MTRAITRKATFILDAQLLADLSEAVEQGAAPTKDALVERALRRELGKARLEQTRRALWEEAARDPLFQQDIADIEADFKYADAETARSIR